MTIVSIHRVIICFNPCFNGTTSATNVISDYNAKSEYSFNPCFNGTTSATCISE